MKKFILLVAFMSLAAPVFSATAPADGSNAAYDDWKAQREQIKRLNAQERSEIQAVRKGSASDEAKAAAVKAIRDKYKAQKRAIRQKYLADREKMRLGEQN